MPQPRQPFLHDLVVMLATPTQVLSSRSGQLHADVRVLSRVEVEVDGRPGEHIATLTGDREVTFSWLLRHVGADLAGGPDPWVRLDRCRQVEPGLVRERLQLSSVLSRPVRVAVLVTFEGDASSIEEIKAGRAQGPQAFPEPVGGRAAWSTGALDAVLTAPGADLALTAQGRTLTTRWAVTLPPADRVEVGWELVVADREPVVVAARPAPLVLDAVVRPGADHRLRPWLERSVADLASLRMARAGAPEKVFLAAGALWYLTLFGRDSIWAARMMLPLDLAPARGTLRALAALQGTRDDPERAEQPGKILVEHAAGLVEGLGTGRPSPLQSSGSRPSKATDARSYPASCRPQAWSAAAAVAAADTLRRRDRRSS